MFQSKKGCRLSNIHLFSPQPKFHRSGRLAIFGNGQSADPSKGSRVSRANKALGQRKRLMTVDVISWLFQEHPSPSPVPALPSQHLAAAARANEAERQRETGYSSLPFPFYCNLNSKLRQQRPLSATYLPCERRKISTGPSVPQS